MNPRSLRPSFSRFSQTGNLTKISLLVLVLGLLIIPLFSSSLASIAEKSLKPNSIKSTEPTVGKANVGRQMFGPAAVISTLPVPMLQAQGESITTYASDCTTPKSDFFLGEQVCAKATGVPNTVFPYRVLWVDPDGNVRQSDVTNPDPDTEYRFNIPSTPTSVVNGQTVDNRGTWRANLVRSNGSVRQTARFTVREAANPVADVFVQKFQRDSEPVSQGGNVAFIIIVGNNGPDPAATVSLDDDIPAGSTLLSFSQQSGPPCLPAGSNDCTMSTLANGERAEFTAIYDTGSTPPGTVETSASVSSLTTDSDPSNNEAVTKFEISDSGGGSSCTLICPTSPAPVDNEPGRDGATVDWDGPNNDNVPVTSGDCGSVTVSTTSPRYFSIGVTPITVTTESGESCTFAVTVVDVEDPVIGDCPSNITVPESSPGSGQAEVDFQIPSATDNSGNVEVGCNPPPGSSFTVAGSPHMVTCTATDGAGRTDECTFTVTVTSNASDCTLTPPADVVATADANACGTNVTYTMPTQSGEDCGTVTCDRPSGSFFPVGETFVTCSDTSGASTNFKVTVEDETAPVPNQNPLPTAQGQCVVQVSAPTATDNCGGTIAGSTQDPTTYDTPGTYTVHWTYTDESGNTTNQNQTVIVDPDTSDPVITACAANRTITADENCAFMPDMTEEIQATDNCSTVTVTQSPAPGTQLSSGATQVTFTVTDNAGNTDTCTATVTVNDGIPPTVTAPDDSSADAGANCQAAIPDYAAGSTAADNCGTPTVTQSPAAGTMVGLGPHTVTVTATDAAGNTANDTVVFTVNDNTDPTVDAPDDSTAEADASCQAVIPDYASASTASDNCDTSLTVTQSPAAGSPVGPGTHEVTVTATDDAGNTGTDTVVFTVVDATDPVVVGPADSSASADESCQAPVPDYAASSTATDNCDTSLTISQSPAAGTMVGPGSHTVTVTATDDAGNSGSDTVVFTVNDTTAPVITCPANVNEGTDPGTCSSDQDPGTATATDNCDSSPTITGTRSDGQPLNAPYPRGVTTITWTATDDAGNSDSCTQTVTVTDDEDPTINVVAQTSMWPPNHKYKTFQVSNFVTGVTDNCDGNIGVSSVVITKVTSDELENSGGDGNTLNDIVIGANCRSVQLRSERSGGGNGRVYTIFFSVTDGAGNVGTATTRVIVPHNNGAGAVDDGPHYTVDSSNCP